MTDTPAPAAPDPLDDFVALSALLTGIAAKQLHPDLDTHGTAAEYLAYAVQHGGASFTQLMTIYRQNAGRAPPVLAELILKSSGPLIADMAHTVMLMWYLGAWYEPAALADYVERCQAASPTDPAPFPPNFVVISSDAYTQGWAWRVGQAHPMGYSDLRFGYWNGPPQPLEDLVGV
jgi:hypothetical protein